MLKKSLVEWNSYLARRRKFANEVTSTMAYNSANLLDSMVNGYDKCKDVKIKGIFDGEKLQGVIYIEDAPDNIRVSFLAVAPWNVIGIKGRHKQCGTKLMHWVFKRAVKNIKIKYIDLLSHVDAVTFYEKMGFSVSGSTMKIKRRGIYGQLGKQSKKARIKS
jgi:hypothetical protein